MAIVSMRHLTLYGLKKDRKSIMELLQRRGVVEITPCPVEDERYQPPDVSAARAVFDKRIHVMTQALAVLEREVDFPSSMFSSREGRRPITVEDYESFASDRDEIFDVAEQLNTLDRQITEQQADIIKCRTQQEALTPWKDLDIPLSTTGTTSTAVLIGSLPQEYSTETLLSVLAEKLPETDVSLEILRATPEQTCLFLLCLKPDADAVLAVLNNLGFARPAVTGRQPTAAMLAQLDEQIAKDEQGIEAAKKSIADCAGFRHALQFTIDHYTMRSEKYEMIGQLKQSGRLFILTGWLPEKKAPALVQDIEAHYDAAVEIEAPAEGEQPPVLLKNGHFSSPVESVVESFGLPAGQERDPTSIMAIFYYFLFGMMLSDAAYGLIMVIATTVLLRKFPNMERGMRQSLRMFRYGGISTAIWGVLFGGYFGDAPAVIASTFFGSDFSIPPLWFSPVDEPMRMLMFSFLVGIIHLFTGLGVKLVDDCRNGHIKDGIYDVVFWYMLVGGGIVYLLTVPTFLNMAGLSFRLPDMVGTIAAICAGIGAIGIVLTAGRDSRSPVKRLLKGLYGLYNVTGYLSDILSYSRLLALGLATGVIATVFNKMGSMAGGGVAGVILFIVVFLIGHTLNIGINLLGAYVHTNRLQFVEFFGKFYEGGGKAFAPFSAHTRYYKFKEDQ